jgi:EAL domain-containing protein (putative c-di-GMP-specific phosphodiesterase class I)
VGTVKRALDETGLEPGYLDLELTESALMQDPELAVAILEVLKRMGVRLAIDDFGTGYSSLSYLKKFPVDAVKIDQSFIRDITSNPDDAAISGAVVAMAHSLKLTVIAEGVETLEQLEFLKLLNCDEMQGYFISRPVPAWDFTLGLLTGNAPEELARVA